MDELISKRAVIEAIEKARANVGHNLERSIGKTIIEILDDVGRDVDRLPSAQPERIKGRWEQDGHHIRCDQCGMYMCDTDREGDRIPTEFCPHCGVDMREETT